METKKPSFADLENQMAKDTLEKALKALHAEVIKDIQKNKNDFSAEIKKTMEDFKGTLEQHIADEIDKTLSRQMTTQFQDISLQVKTNFYEMFSPVLETTKREMYRLKEQGDSTLMSWKDMMLNYKDLWTKPFFIVFFTAILTGVVVSLVSSFMLMRKQQERLNSYEFTLSSYKEMVLWYGEREKEREKIENKKTITHKNGNKSNAKLK